MLVIQHWHASTEMTPTSLPVSGISIPSLIANKWDAYVYHIYILYISSMHTICYFRSDLLRKIQGTAHVGIGIFISCGEIST